jgi:hypothetical protein
MPVDQQRVARAVRAFQAGEHIAPPGGAGLRIFDLVADVLQLGGNRLGAFGLALGGFQLAGVGGVEPDQPADDVHDVVDGLSAGTITVTLPTIVANTAAQRAWSAPPRAASSPRQVWVLAQQSDSLSCQLIGLVRVAEWQTR